MNPLLRTAMLAAAVSWWIVELRAQEPPSRGAEREVLAVVDRFFALISDRDSAGMAMILEPEGVLFAVPIGPEARPPVAITHGEYLSSLNTGKAALLERYWEPTVRVDGAVATVWAPYDLHVDGTFAHCGHDVFTLVRHAEGWKIAGGVFSMRKQGCPEGPLGPVTH